MPGKVLIADDSLKVQRDLTALLKGAGIEVVTVSNGEHAVRKLPTVQPDLVLADIFMPVRDGYEVCDFIKHNAEFHRTRVLLLVSKIEPYDENKAKMAGADGKLEKPIEDTAATLAVIKQHLEKVLASKPAPAAAPIDEFAAAVPAEGEAAAAPEAEPEADLYASRQAPVRFDQSAPMGFTEEVSEEAPARSSVAESSEVVDLNQATMLTTAAELQRRIAEERTAPPPPQMVVEAAPVVEPAPAEADVDLSQATTLTTADELQRRMAEERAAAPPSRVIEEAVVMPADEAPTVIMSNLEQPIREAQAVEKPELAAPWEMSGPEPGAPEIPAGGGWDSQWKDTGEAAVPPGEAPASQAYAPEEFAAAMSAALGSEPAPVTDEPAAEAPPEQVGEELATAMAASSGVDPAVVDEIVNRVLERLSPQVMDTIAREIVRPLAEALLREHLQQ